MFGNVWHLRMMNKNAPVLRSWQVSRKRSSSSIVVAQFHRPRIDPTLNRPDPATKTNSFNQQSNQLWLINQHFQASFNPKWSKKNSFNQLQPSLFWPRDLSQTNCDLQKLVAAKHPRPGSRGKFPKKTYPRCVQCMGLFTYIWEGFGG